MRGHWQLNFSVLGQNSVDLIGAALNPYQIMCLNNTFLFSIWSAQPAEYIDIVCMKTPRREITLAKAKVQFICRQCEFMSCFDQFLEVVCYSINENRLLDPFLRNDLHAIFQILPNDFFENDRFSMILNHFSLIEWLHKYFLNFIKPFSHVEKLPLHKPKFNLFVESANLWVVLTIFFRIDTVKNQFDTF